MEVLRKTCVLGNILVIGLDGALRVLTIYRVMLLLSLFSHVRICATPIDGSPSGSPIPQILQARILEWVAISFSNA